MNLKPLVLLCILALPALAETNDVKTASTNYVTAAPHFREVDGQLYNVYRSKKWETIVAIFTSNCGGFAVFRTVPLTPNTDPRLILVKHYQDTNILTGKRVLDSFLRVGQTNYNGEVVAIYDYGTPHKVPVATPKTTKRK